jgi:putative transferase (TIGR04331 family)
LNNKSDYLFEKLRKIGIFHTTPESAARHIVKIWNDIEGWWQDLELQRVRVEYCRAYAYRLNNIKNRVKIPR